jgi:hypothetical protein
LKTTGFCFESSIDFSASRLTKDLTFTEKEVITDNAIAVSEIKGYEVKEDLFYNLKFSSDIQVLPKCYKYIPGLMKQEMPSNEAAKYYSLCFLLLQLVPIIVALIPELQSQDGKKQNQMLVNIPRSVKWIRRNYRKQNKLNSNRVLTLTLFLVEMLSVVMCSLLTYGFFKTKGKNLKFISMAGCFPPIINKQVLDAVI